MHFCPDCGEECNCHNGDMDESNCDHPCATFEDYDPFDGDDWEQE